MKIRYKCISLIFVIFTVSLIGLFSEYNLASIDINYTFQDNVLYNSNTSISMSDYDYSFNLKDEVNYNGIYNATFSFTNEIDGTTNTDITFIDSTTGTSSINNSLGNHNKILQHENGKAKNDFIHDVDEGSIEFWTQINDLTDNVGMIILDGATECLILKFCNYDGKLEYNDGGYIEVMSTLADVWIHHRLVIDSANTFDWYVNGILELDDGGLTNNIVDGLDGLQLYSQSSGMDLFIDAIGYSWDGYNATYTNTEESDGNTGTSIDFINSCSTTANTEVINNFNGHYKVISQTNVGGNDYFRHNFDSDYSNGIVEFWLSIVDVSEYNVIRLYDESTYVFDFRIVTNKWYHYTSGGNVEIVGTPPPVNNEWNHIKFEWFNDNTWNIYINGNLSLNLAIGQDTQTNGIDKIHVATYDHTLYFDSFGNNWTSYYNIGDNLEYYADYENFRPSEVKTGYQEVDRYEFQIDGIDSWYFVGADNPSTWSDIDTGNDKVNIFVEGADESYEREIEIINLGTHGAESYGIEKDDFGVKRGIIDIEWEIEYSLWEIPSADLKFLFYSYDDTLIVNLSTSYISGSDFGLFYSDGTHYQEIRDDLDENEKYSFRLQINGDACSFEYYIDGVYTQTYFFDLLDKTKDGLNKITIVDVSTSAVGGIDNNIYIDYVGVYVNGSSISLEPTYATLEITNPLEYWYLENHNLVNTTVYGLVNMFAVHQLYTITISPLLEIIDYGNHNGTNDFINVAGKTLNGNDYLQTPHLVIYTYNETIISNISITGVQITDGTNNYFAETTYGNVDINESYYYVDTNNNLRYRLIINDSNTEYIQLNFDIIDFSDDNYSMYFRGYENGNGIGYYGVNYDDATSNSFDIPTAMTYVNNYLNLQRNIDEIVILITDNNEYSSGINIGKMTNINFMYIRNADLSLATLTLTNVILNLIVILVPSLIIYYGFDKKRDVLLISMILMLIVSFATSLIPLWLFFLGLVCMGLFFFIKTEGDSF